MEHKHEHADKTEEVPVFTRGKEDCNCGCGAACTCHKRHHHGRGGNPAGAVYGLGFVGACVYYFSTAATFWLGVLGFLKALVWPAFIVYELMKFLHM